VLDFGMENCSLSLTIPPRNSTRDVLHTDLGDSVILDVWSLPAKHKLDLYNLSWSKLPQPRVHIGHMNVSYGTTYRMPSFSCKSQSYQTFAVSCSSPGCLVNVTGKDVEPSGVIIMSTIVDGVLTSLTGRAIYVSESNNLTRYAAVPCRQRFRLLCPT
jgi:hypothetical protein